MLSNSTSNGYKPVLFGEKTRLTAEEIAARKAMEAKAPGIRSSLPATLQLFSPLPPNTQQAKYGQIQGLLSKVEKDGDLEGADTFKTQLGHVVAADDEAEASTEALHQEEKDVLHTLSNFLRDFAGHSSLSDAALARLTPGFFKDLLISRMLTDGYEQKTYQYADDVQSPGLKADVQARMEAAGPQEQPSALAQSLLAEPPEKQELYLPPIAAGSRDARNSLLKVLYSPVKPVSDEVKRQIIEAVVRDKNSDTSDIYKIVPLLATMESAEMRAETESTLHAQASKLRDEYRYRDRLSTNYHYQDLEETISFANRIGKLDKASQLQDGSAMLTLFQKASQPLLDAGIDFQTTQQLVKIMQNSGQDVGNLITAVLPAYEDVMKFAKEHPERLVKAGSEVPDEAQVEKIIKDRRTQILQAIVVIGPASVKNVIYQKRLDNLHTIMNHASQLQPESLQMVSKLARTVQDPYDAYQLLEFAGSFQEVDKEELFKQLLAPMAEAGKLDLNQLGKGFLKAAFSGSALENVEISDEQVGQWNLKYISKLATALSRMRGHEKDELIDLCTATLKGKYPEYLHDPKTKVGKNNNATKEAFETTFKDVGISMDYQKWLDFDGQVNFTQPTEKEELAAILQELGPVLSTAWPNLQSYQRDHIEKSLENNGLAFTKGQIETKDEKKFSSAGLRHILSDWRYDMDLPRDTKKALSALYQRAGNLRPGEPEALNIRLWDRQPGHDLFLGSYTQACTAIENGGEAGFTSVQANQNTFVQVAYLRRQDSDAIVGKSVFYMAKDNKTGLPVMILNTFEGRGHEGNYEHNKQIRDQFLEFAKQYSRAVVGYEVPVYTGITLNPLFREDLPREDLDIDVVGNSMSGKYYLDSLPDSTQSVTKSHRTETDRMYAGGELPADVAKHVKTDGEGHAKKKDPDGGPAPGDNPYTGLNLPPGFTAFDLEAGAPTPAPASIHNKNSIFEQLENLPPFYGGPYSDHESVHQLGPFSSSLDAKEPEFYSLSKHFPGQGKWYDDPAFFPEQMLPNKDPGLNTKAEAAKKIAALMQQHRDQKQLQGTSFASPHTAFNEPPATGAPQADRNPSPLRQWWRKVWRDYIIGEPARPPKTPKS